MARVIATLMLLFSLGPDSALQGADGRIPHGIAGIEVNRPVGEFKDRLRMESALAVRFQEYLAEVELKPVEGIKTGLIAYGTCADPGRIVRIKIKYADSSKSFFDALLRRFKARFGEPMEWRGDPFHVMLAWKWSFRDAQGNQISLTLQHNSQDQDQKMGNAVKLNLNNAIEAERSCFLARRGSDPADPADTAPKDPDAGRLDWELLIPR